MAAFDEILTVRFHGSLMPVRYHGSMSKGADMTTKRLRTDPPANEAENAYLARDERLFAAACEYEQTLAAAKLLEMAAMVVGSWRSLFLLRR
jgi:hypothetical protein